MIPDSSMQAEAKQHSGGVGPRPWTVTALLALYVASTVWGFIFGEDSLWSNLLGLVLGGVLMYGTWKGKTWAYLLMFSLVALVFVLFGIIFFVIRPPDMPSAMIPSFVLVAVQLGLLMHPETKRYAGVGKLARSK